MRLLIQRYELTGYLLLRLGFHNSAALLRTLSIYILDVFLKSKRLLALLCKISRRVIPPKSLAMCKGALKVIESISVGLIRLRNAID